MSRQQGGNGNGDVARGAGYAALLGAVLIGVAVVVGIVLLQIGDRNDNGPAANANPTTPSTSTTTVPKTGTTVAGGGVTTTTSAAPRPPSAVSVIVLNGGAAAGKAGDMTDTLRRKGYTNIGDATDWPGHTQKGNSVYCRAGLEREGTALAVQVGQNVVTHIPYPASGGPPNDGNRDCVVVVGSPG